MRILMVDDSRVMRQIVTRTLRSRGDATPFGFVTSEGSSDMVGRAEAAGARFVITKPFTAEGFHEKLEPVLG